MPHPSLLTLQHSFLSHAQRTAFQCQLRIPGGEARAGYVRRGQGREGSTRACKAEGDPAPSSKDPSIQIIPTLGPKVCKYYLHWAIWIHRDVQK